MISTRMLACGLEVEVALAPKTPLDAAALLRDADDMLAELALEPARPGHEPEAETVIEHGEAAGGERQALAIDARDMLPSRGLDVREPGFGRELLGEASSSRQRSVLSRSRCRMMR